LTKFKLEDSYGKAHRYLKLWDTLND